MGQITDRPEQTVESQIKLLLKEQFDQGLQSLPSFSCIIAVKKPNCLIFRTSTIIILGVPIYRICMTLYYRIVSPPCKVMELSRLE